MSEIIIKEKSFLELNNQEKLLWRWMMIVNGYFLFALCIEPETPMMNQISLFAMVNTKPLFLQFVTSQMLKDNGYLNHLIDKHFPV